MTFYVGQKVVRVPHAPDRGAIETNRALSNGAALTQVGRVYTIREIRVDNGTTEVLLLRELDNSNLAGLPWAGPREPGFRSSGFRPVVERKTDISIFTEMLNPSHASVSA